MAVAALASLLLGNAALAQTFQLDDSTSPRSRVPARFAVDETGQPLSRSLEPDHAILRFGTVPYRLDLRAHQGRTARLYFVRPPEAGPPTGTRLNWASDNGNLRGSLLSGERALIWSGKVTQDWMTLSLQLDLDLDLHQWPGMGRAQSANQITYFELER